MSKGTIRKVAFTLAAGQDRIVSPKEASFITNRSLSSMWRDERAGRFPQKIKTGTRSVGYWLSELVAWLESRERVTPETAQPVAMPEEGKRRGRPSAVAKTTESAELVMVEPESTKPEIVEPEPANPTIERFRNVMLKIGIAPPKEIVADCKFHFICRGMGYMLDLNNPAIGLFGDRKRGITRIWTRTPVEKMNSRQKTAYQQKLKMMKRLAQPKLRY